MSKLTGGQGGGNGKDSGSGGGGSGSGGCCSNSGSGGTQGNSCTSPSRHNHLTYQHGHSFIKKTFHKPTNCHYCGDLLWGLMVQGYVCEGRIFFSIYPPWYTKLTIGQHFLLLITCQMNVDVFWIFIDLINEPIFIRIRIWNVFEQYLLNPGTPISHTSYN